MTNNKPLYLLTATEALPLLRSGSISAEAYAKALLARIEARDGAIKAWAYLDPIYVLDQARALDSLPVDKRGPLHGLPIAIKDVIYTKDMPTAHNSPIYKDSFPKVDAASVTLLRHAGALIFGKTTTTEFAATTIGPATTNPNSPDQIRTPGGSSAGSGAAVSDHQLPLALGTQTGGSIIRPASFCGIYGFKPTWGAVSREGQKLYSYLLDTLGWYGRCVGDLEMLADVFGVVGDVEGNEFKGPGVKGLKVGVIRTGVWHLAGPGTIAAMEKGANLLSAHGASITTLTLPSSFDPLPLWNRALLHTDGQATFLADNRASPDKLHPTLAVYVDEPQYGRREQLDAQDGIARLRPEFDRIAGEFDVILTPSVVDEAPVGLGFTGEQGLCSMWTALHGPVVNVPGFKGDNGMPIGLTLAAPRFRDRHLLAIAHEVGKIFEAEGGWTRTVYE